MELIRTHIDKVTVFDQAALVTRIGDLPKPQGNGSTIIKIENLPLILEDSSIRASVENASVWSVRNVQVEVDRKTEEEPRRIEDKIEEMEKDLEKLQSEFYGIELQIRMVQHWMTTPFPKRPTLSESEGVPDVFPLDAWQSFVQVCNTHLDELYSQHRAHDLRIYQSLKELELTRQMARNIGQPSSKDPMTRYCKNLFIRLSAQNDLEGTSAGKLSLSYIVPGVQWRPIYQLYIDKDFLNTRLVLGAQVAQRSGETWRNTQMSFSAARLERITQLPDLPSRRIGRAQPKKPASFRIKEPISEMVFRSFDAWYQETISQRKEVISYLTPALERCSSKLRDIGNLQVVEGTDFMAPPSPVPPSRPSQQPQLRVATKRVDMPEKGITAGDYFGVPLTEPPVSASAGDMTPPPPAPPPAYSPQAPSPKAMALGGKPTTATGGMYQPHDMPGRGGQAAKKQKRQRAEEAKPEMEAEPIETESSSFFGKLSGARRMSFADGMSMDKEIQDESAAAVDPIQLSTEVASRVNIHNYFQFRLEGAEPEHRNRRGQLRAVRMLKVSNRIWESESTVIELIQNAKSRSRISVFDGDQIPSYQYLYEAKARASVPCDGHPHAVEITSGEAPSKLTYRAFPMTDPQVFQRLCVRNPFDVPLPQGKVQVFVDNAYIFSTYLNGVPTGGEAYFPMGVEQRLKIARNTSFQQEERGMLGGKSAAMHRVSITLRSQLAHAANVEIMERIPVINPDEGDIEMKILEAKPAVRNAEFVDGTRIRGTQMWTVHLEPGESTQMEVVYEITLPSKMEVIGGNRRV